jgi:predicted nucleic acid-binding protein
MLLDSNIIIYSTKPEYDFLRDFIAENSPSVSAVSYVEVLGYHKLTDDEKELLEDFFVSTQILLISHEITKKAVELRQSKKMTLGDALIAATVLVNNFVLVTNNTKDFDWIDGLKLLNPLENI